MKHDYGHRFLKRRNLSKKEKELQKKWLEKNKVKQLEPAYDGSNYDKYKG